MTDILDELPPLERSAAPWAYKQFGEDSFHIMRADQVDFPSRYRLATVHREVDAEFVVRAVNCHAELMSAAKLLLQLDAECHDRPNKFNGLLSDARERVETIIAKAEGKL